MHSTSPRVLCLAALSFLACGPGPVTFASDPCLSTFTLEPSFSIEPNGGASLIADLDRDGQLDLSIGYDLYLGDGMGAFPRKKRLSSSITTPAFDFRAVDFDGDGLRDLVITGFGGGMFSFYYGEDTAEPDEFFSEEQIVSTQPYSAGIWHLEVGDFNGDSLIDLVGVARGGAHVVLLNQGFRTFDVSPVLTREPAGHMLAVGDFDGDTKDDLAIGNAIYCSIFFGKGDGTFEDEVIGELEHDGEYLSGHRFRAADIDGDGRDDLFATAGRSVLGYLGRDISRSTGIPHVPSFALPVRGNARFLEIADVNADGLLDIAVLAGAERGSVTRVFFGASGEAGPTFVAGEEIPTELSPQGSVLAVGDLNGDGARELVITTEDFPWQARLLTNDANCAGKAAARGDGNLDGGVNVSDAVAVLGFLFSGGSLPCPAAAEVNGDDTLNLSDPVYLLGYLFLGGSPPVGSELVDCK